MQYEHRISQTEKDGLAKMPKIKIMYVGDHICTKPAENIP